MSEIYHADTWITSTLRNDTQLTSSLGSSGAIYDTVIPQSAGTSAYPCILFQVQSPGMDVMQVGATRIMTNPLYLVRVVAKTNNSSAIQTIVDRLDTLLHKGTNNTQVYGCIRESPFKMKEVSDGVVYIHQGGFYRIYVT